MVAVRDGWRNSPFIPPLQSPDSKQTSTWPRRMHQQKDEPRTTDRVPWAAVLLRPRPKYLEHSRVPPSRWTPSSLDACLNWWRRWAGHCRRPCPGTHCKPPSPRVPADPPPRLLEHTVGSRCGAALLDTFPITEPVLLSHNCGTRDVMSFRRLCATAGLSMRPFGV